MHGNVLQDHGANQISLQEVSVTVSLTDVSGLYSDIRLGLSLLLRHQTCLPPYLADYGTL